MAVNARHFVSNARFLGAEYWAEIPVTGEGAPWLPLGSQINGAAVLVDANDLLSAAGGPTIAGTSTLNDGDDALAAAGGPVVAGAAVLGDEADALISAGGPTINGLLVATDENDNLSATGNADGAPVNGPSGGLTWLRDYVPAHLPRRDLAKARRRSEEVLLMH